MSDTADLIAEIDAYLAAGGEPADLSYLLQESQQLQPEEVANWWRSLTETERTVLLAYYQERAEAIRRAIETLVQQVYDAIDAVIDAVYSALAPVVNAFAETCRQMLEAIAAQVIKHPLPSGWQRRAEAEQRAALASRLRRWRLPDWLAVWLAWQWPKR